MQERQIKGMATTMRGLWVAAFLAVIIISTAMPAHAVSESRAPVGLARSGRTPRVHSSPSGLASSRFRGSGARAGAVMAGGGVAVGSVDGRGPSVSGSPAIPAQSSSYYLGEGLAEPCPPYSTAQVFGAPLGTVSASGWNCLPDITGATTSFNVSTIMPNEEVAVELYELQDITYGTTVTCQWFNSNSQALYDSEYQYNIPSPQSEGYSYWAWVYVDCYAGYDAWQVNSNGSYYVVVSNSATGATQSTNFTVTGMSVSLAATLTLTTSGLPAGCTASVDVTGADGYDSGSEVISSVQPVILGPLQADLTYSVQASGSTCDGDFLYANYPSGQDSFAVYVPSAQTTTFPVSWAATQEGIAAIAVNGIPAGVDLSTVNNGSSQPDLVGQSGLAQGFNVFDPQSGLVSLTTGRSSPSARTASRPAPSTTPAPT